MSTNLPEFVKVGVALKGRAKKYSIEDERKYCLAWRQSGLSMNEYCRRHGLAISTLSKWNQRVGSGELSVIPTAKSTNVNPQNAEIVLGNGIRLRFSEIGDVAGIVKLVHGLSS